MKYCILLIVIFFNSNLIFSNNFTSGKTETDDSCKVIKLDTLPQEILKVLKDDNIFNCNEKHNEKYIIIIDCKKINDSISIYTITYSISLIEVLFDIPSYYFTNECSITCIYTGNENPDKINYNCIESFLKDTEKYSIDSIKVESKSELIFRRNRIQTSFFHAMIRKYKLINGKIISEEQCNERLYSKIKNKKPKITLYLKNQKIQ